MREPDAHQADILKEAQSLYALGLNLIPLIFGTKKPLGKWKDLQRGRIAAWYLETIFGRADRPFSLGIVCGATSGNLFVIDCDTREIFERIQAELRQRGIDTWTRTSPRGGHFYFLCADGEVENFSGNGYEIKGHSCYVLAAPSVHPVTGEVLHCDKPAPLPLTVTLAQLDFIDGLKIHRKTRPTEKPGSLPEVADRVLIQKNTKKYRCDNSVAERRTCLSLLGAGYNEEQIIELFRHYQPPHFQTVGEANFRKYVLAKAIAFRKENNAPAAPPVRFQKFIEGLLKNPLPGREGGTDTFVLCALFYRASKDGNPFNFRASIRELSELANKAPGTVQKSLTERLIPCGFITQVSPDSRSSKTSLEANRYRLNIAAIQEHINQRHITPLTTQQKSRFEFLQTGNAENDGLHRFADGTTGGLIIACLADEKSRRIADIATDTRRDKSTVRACLEKMQKQGIVLQDGYLWSLSPESTDADLRLAASQRGTLGRSEARKQEYQRQREQARGNRLFLQVERYFSTVTLLPFTKGG